MEQKHYEYLTVFRQGTKSQALEEGGPRGWGPPIG